MNQPDTHGGAAPNPTREDLRPRLVALLPELRAYARFLQRDRARADDLVQESVMRALTALRQFQPDTNLKAWIFTILRRVFLEQTRRAKREAAALMDHAHANPVHQQPHAADISDLSRMLWSLPPSLRESLVLVGAQELTHEEAAAICGVPVGTMRARVSRARAKLAALTEGQLLTIS
jgi:RNA polymerase sigma-70 factor (ECF subfamily)